jgi:hypothetical protein
VVIPSELPSDKGRSRVLWNPEDKRTLFRVEMGKVLIQTIQN